MMWFSVVAWSVRADLLMLDINLFFPLLVYFSFFMLSTSFLCSSGHVFSSLPVSPMYSAPQFLHGVWYTSLPCSSSSTLSLGCTNKRLRVVWGRMAVATPYFFSTTYDYLAPEISVIYFVVVLFLLTAICHLVQGPGRIATYS